MALSTAVHLARSEQAELVLCHVVDSAKARAALADLGTAFVSPFATSQQWIDTLTSSGNETLRQATARALKDGITAESHLLERRPAQEIVDLSSRLKVDLIVIGSHGRSGYQDYFSAAFRRMSCV
ncbi:MAG: universal stress protein [Candidatus Eremiobacteraeota bacterium]|nr:universal stress protein [Candidatus Eremiobacteraeota bacterium]